MAAIKETLADRVFNAVILVILTLFLLIVAYPLYFIIIASFPTPPWWPPARCFSTPGA